MKTIFAVILFAITASAHAERVDKTLQVERGGEVHIDVIEGKVVVEGWEKSEIKVTGNVPDVENFVFKTSGNDTRIEVESKHGFWGRSRSGGYAKLTIKVPRQSSVTSEGASSSFVIVGIEGQVDASSMSGDISLDGGSGRVQLESVSGDIDVVGATGKLSLSSVSGDINAKVDAPHFEAQSVSGSIDASIGRAEHVSLESVSGDIELILALTPGGELEADTVSGDIEIKFLNDDLDAEFEIETGPGGTVKNNLTSDKSSGFMFSGSLEFRVGKGKGSVDLETMSGTIRLGK